VAKKVAVIVNDFGKVAVDASLIKSSEENMIVFRNGCVCCTLASDLSLGLQKLIERDSYTQIIMETSGLTQVRSLRQIFEQPDLGQRVYLDRVVAVVDALNFLKIRTVVGVVDEQVRNSNVILLNRIDLISPEQRNQVLDAIREVNPDAPLLVTTFCQVTMDQLRFSQTIKVEPNDSGPQVGDSWITCRLVFNKLFSGKALQEVLNELPESVLRLKGFVGSTEGEIFHVERVGDLLNIEPWTQPVSPKTKNVLVAIGSKSLKVDLEKSLADVKGIKIIGDTSFHQH